MPLQWRVFVCNAVILAVATLVLAISPATVSFPVALTEALVLAAGFGAMLVLNLVLLRRAFGPLTRLGRLMRTIDPLRPGSRAAMETSDREVADLAFAFNDMIDRLETERRESARRALAAQEGERARIARELHDQVGQTLTAVVLQLEQAGRDADPDVRREVVAAREAVRSSLEDVRGIARGLRPEALDDLGLRSALAALSVEVSSRTRLRVERRLATKLPALSQEQELVIYRVAQEALTNAARHSGAARAWVSLDDTDGAVELSVRDDGDGFDGTVAERGGGVRGMRERAVLIGASLSIESRPGDGVTVRLRLTPGASP